MMEKLIDKAEELAEEIRDYADTRIGLLKLSAAEKSSKLAGSIVAKVIAAVILVIALLFASFALAFVFSALTGQLYWGFLIVSGIYLIAGIILWKSIKRYTSRIITNNLLEELFKEEKES